MERRFRLVIGSPNPNVNDGLVYDHNGSETTADSFTFTVANAIFNATGTEITGLVAGTETDVQIFNITITPVNDAPTATASPAPAGGHQVTEDGNTEATGTVTLADDDADDTQANLGVRFTAGATPLDPTSSSSSVDADGSTTIDGAYGRFTISRDAAGQVTGLTAKMTATPPSTPLRLARR